MNKTYNRIISYISRNIIRFLLLFVIITFGFSMRTAVFTKYNAYLNDLTSAVAGDFIFSSDYLFEGGATHTINTFNGDEHEIPINIMNYENSLRYNPSGTDFYYMVTAKVYTNPECTTENPSYKHANGVKVNYKNGVALKDTVGGKSVEYGIVRGFSPNNENTYSSLVEQGAGKSSFTVSIDSDGTLYDTVYVKIEAEIIPLGEMAYLLSATNVEKTEISETEKGVYYGKLSAVFQLNKTSQTADFDDDFYDGADYDYGVTYRIKCRQSSGGTATAKVYYDSSKVTPDQSFGTPESDTYQREEGHSCDKYILVTCSPGGSVYIPFYKKTLSTDVQIADFAVVKATDIVQDDTDYTITHGDNVAVKNPLGESVETAKVNTALTITVTPPSGKKIKEVFISGVELDAPTVDPSTGEYTYQINMPASNIHINAVFGYQLTWIFDEALGSIQSEFIANSIQEPGAQISFTVFKNNDNLEVTAVVNDGEPLVSDHDSFTFTMPEQDTTVSITFTEAEPDSGDENGENGGDSGGGETPGEN